MSGGFAQRKIVFFLLQSILPDIFLLSTSEKRESYILKVHLWTNVVNLLNSSSSLQCTGCLGVTYKGGDNWEVCGSAVRPSWPNKPLHCNALHSEHCTMVHNAHYIYAHCTMHTEYWCTMHINAQCTSVKDSYIELHWTEPDSLCYGVVRRHHCGHLIHRNVCTV